MEASEFPRVVQSFVTRAEPSATIAASHTARPMPTRTPSGSADDLDAATTLKSAHWVRPELVAEINYLTWADGGLLRQPGFIGPRDDKPAREARRERPA